MEIAGRLNAGKDAHVLKSFLTLQYGQTVAIDRADGPGSAEIDNDTSQHKGKNAQSPLNDAAREPRQQRVACRQQRGSHDRCRYKLSPNASQQFSVQAVAIGGAHVCTPVTNAPLVCRHLLEKQHTYYRHVTQLE